jgi:hypothetical protein
MVHIVGLRNRQDDRSTLLEYGGDVLRWRPASSRIRAQRPVWTDQTAQHLTLGHYMDGAHGIASGKVRAAHGLGSFDHAFRVFLGLVAILLLYWANKNKPSHYERACFPVRLEGLEPPAFWSAKVGSDRLLVTALLLCPFLHVFSPSAFHCTQFFHSLFCV